MSYVFIQSERPSRDTTGLWTVGFFGPDGKWVPESDHGSTAEAAARVHYLNGGAAAPRLLAACEQALEFVADQEDVCDGDDGHQLPNRAMVVAGLLREAAAATEGAAPADPPKATDLPALPVPFTAQVMCGENTALFTADQMHAHSAAVAAVLVAQGAPIGFLAAYELDRLRSGHDARLRSPLAGPSQLDCDVPVYAAPAAPLDDAWLAVPAEPTPEMTSAYLKAQHAAVMASDAAWGVSDPKKNFAAGYRAMLAARPAAPLPGEPALTAEQLDILQHTIGLRQGRPKVDRNHFVTGEGSTDYPICMSLVKAGLMTVVRGSPLTGGNDLFQATEAGKRAAQP